MNHVKMRLHWFVFVIGLIVTGWATMYVENQVQRKAQDSFNLKVQDVDAAIVKRLRSYEDILYGVAGLYRATDGVTPEEFDLYCESLNIKERFPALKTINFAQFFSENERENFVRTYSTNTGGRSNKNQLALPVNRNEYMVLMRAYPAAMSLTLGTELFASTARLLQNPGSVKTTFHSSEYLSNKVVSSGMQLRVRGRAISSLAARLAIYKTGKDGTLHFSGTAGIGFDIPTFFKEAVPATLAKELQYKMVNVGRSDGTKYSPAINVFDSRDIGTGIDINSSRFLNQNLLKRYFDIPFGGALLRVEVTSPRDAFIEPYEKYLPTTVLVAGMLLFGSIGISLYRMLSANVILDKAVTNRTIELQCEVNRTKSLERELAVVIESERTRIGRELHDNLGQRLTGISLSAEILAVQLLPICKNLSEKANELERATSEAMAEVRTLAHGLIPVASGREGLRDALAHLAADITRLSGINCTFDFDDPVDVVDENVSVHLYRITQEALNNAIRHAHADSIDVRLDYLDEKVSLSITDNGCGFDTTHKESGHHSGVGLNTITYRASIINYDLQIISSVKNGTTVRVTEC